MKRAHHVIYIPGLGDYMNRGEQQLLLVMKLLGVKPHFYRMNWASGKFDPKLKSLIKEIDAYAADGSAVSLLGFSAGASAALNAYAARKNVVANVVCVSGKIQRAEIIGAQIAKDNPAFIRSMALLAPNLAVLSDDDKARIMSIHPLSDGTVAVQDTIIPGAREQSIPVRGHAVAIIYSLTIFAPRIVRFMTGMPNKI